MLHRVEETVQGEVACGLFQSSGLEILNALGPVDIHLWIALPLKGAGCKAPARRKAHALQERATQQTVPFSGNPQEGTLIARHSSLRFLCR